ncbi:MAG TPA: hypothetical protein VM054_06795 [bacterium]|nr:hypothetical protein [bacterium]
MKLSPRMEIFIVYGGLVAAAALLVRRFTLLLQAGWSAEASVGGLLYTLLDLLSAGMLLLVFLPARRGRATGLKTVVYALAAVGVKTSWSLLDWGRFSTWFTLTDLAICLAGVLCLLGALALLRRSEEGGD